MKNVKKLIGIIAFVAVIGFTITACNNGGGGIATNIKFSNQMPPLILPARSARSMGGTTEHPTAFNALNTFYTTLGIPEKAYTPTKFQLKNDAIFAKVGSQGELVAQPNSNVDFAVEVGNLCLSANPAVFAV